jgi:signal peptidase I
VLAGLRDLAREGPVAVTVRGASMAPLLADGDRVEVAPALLYWPGDVVAFRDDQGRLIVHRLLGYRSQGGRIAGLTRGDAATGLDAPIPLDRLLGRVVAVDGRPARQAGLVSPVLRARAVLALLRLAVRRLLRPVRR